MARRGRSSRGFPKYVPVAQRMAKATRKAKALEQQGIVLSPITSAARQITTTFWGRSWCKHLESFSDYENRLPRGRTYVRNGSVLHLDIQAGQIRAMVSGSHIYEITIKVDPLPAGKWKKLKENCAGGIGSVLELLQGKISENVMKTVCDRDDGLFPTPREIHLDCNCPDWARLCKHLAAVLYGVGVRLDESPELLFELRGVDYQELIGAELGIDTISSSNNQLDGSLSSIFGIDIEDNLATLDKVASKSVARKRSKPASKKTRSKRVAGKVVQMIEKSRANTASGDINISRGIRASHIKRLRRKFQLSEKNLATLTDKSVATIRKWESSEGVLVLQQASRLALEQAFSMSNADIVAKLAVCQSDGS